MPGDTAKPRLLLVDDNPEIREVFTLFVEDHFDVATAEHAMAALELARGQPFDLMLVDLNLSHATSGADLVVLLRAMPQHRDVPIVALTGSARKEEKGRFLALGFTDLLPKPFEVDGLLDFLLEKVSPGPQGTS